MNIYEYAMQMEVDGEQYYLELAAQSDSSGLRRIFQMLADEEVKHYKVVEKMSRRENIPAQLARTEILDKVKNVFAEMKENEPVPRIDTTNATKSFLKARDIEEESEKFYRVQAGKVQDPAQREIFLQLAREEGKHLRIMENIIEFVSRPEPGNWLEDAEWHHLDEY
jgi:rubrerythrin